MPANRSAHVVLMVTCCIACLIVGALVGSSVRQFGEFVASPRPDDVPRVHVPPGEGWAANWDVAAGQPVDTTNGTPSPIIAAIICGKERVGYVLADGRAVVFRHIDVRESAVLLCNPRPAFPYRID